LQQSTVFRLLSLLPAALFPFCAGVPAMGVGHPAKQAPMLKSCGDPFRSISRRDPSSVRAFFSPSAARGVDHPAN
jgi:hypothetical protein